MKLKGLQMGREEINLLLFSVNVIIRKSRYLEKIINSAKPHDTI